MTNILFNKEVFYVKFPIFLPLIYISILYFFPKFETQLVFITILILAETHFGATWPFFLNKVNFNYIRKEKFFLIYLPILLIFFCIIGFFYFKNIFLLIFFAANVYHVTRQSTGIVSLYIKDIDIKNEYSCIIYAYGFLFFTIAFFRFYIPLITSNYIIFLNFIVITTIIITLFIQINKYGFTENFLILISGILIFYPVCFVNNPVHAIIMGVTMHYSQYLYLTNKVIKKREIKEKKNNIYKSFWVIIIVYAMIMSLLSMFSTSNSEFLQNLIFIPITGQILHFYLDSQLWKFSIDHNRENILKHLL